MLIIWTWNACQAIRWIFSSSQGCKNCDACPEEVLHNFLSRSSIITARCLNEDVTDGRSFWCSTVGRISSGCRMLNLTACSVRRRLPTVKGAQSNNRYLKETCSRTKGRDGPTDRRVCQYASFSTAVWVFICSCSATGSCKCLSCLLPATLASLSHLRTRQWSCAIKSGCWVVICLISI